MRALVPKLGDYVSKIEFVTYHAGFKAWER